MNELCSLCCISDPSLCRREKKKTRKTTFSSINRRYFFLSIQREPLSIVAGQRSIAFPIPQQTPINSSRRFPVNLHILHAQLALLTTLQQYSNTFLSTIKHCCYCCLLSRLLPTHTTFLGYWTTSFSNSSLIQSPIIRRKKEEERPQH